MKYYSHNLQSLTNEKVSKVIADAKRFSSITNKTRDMNLRIQRDRIKGQMERVFEKYVNNQKTIVDTVRASIEPRTSLQRLSRVVSLYIKHNELKEASLAERHNEILKLESDILDLNQIFRQLNEMTQDQAEPIGKPDALFFFAMSSEV